MIKMHMVTMSLEIAKTYYVSGSTCTTTTKLL
jgi:hypothetical protein